MRIKASALERVLNMKVEVFSTISSTLDYVIENTGKGLSVPDLVVALHQTKGRGREGKSFYSPPDTGIYMTFSFKKDHLNCSYLTSRCAIAMQSAIRDVFGVTTGLKWVNDIYLEKRKVAGILLHTTEHTVFVSVGVNVEIPKIIPKHLKERFGALTVTCEDEKYQALVISFYQTFLRTLKLPTQQILDEYRRLCIHIDQKVTIQFNGKAIVGDCVGINDDFSLCLNVDGDLRLFNSGVLKLNE